MRKFVKTKSAKRGVIFPAVTLLVSCTLLFTGCAGKADNQAKGTSGVSADAGAGASGDNSGNNYENVDYAYVPEVSKQVIDDFEAEDGEEISWVQDYFVKDGRVYYIFKATKDNKDRKVILIRDISTGEQSVKRLDCDENGEYMQFFNAINGFATYSEKDDIVCIYDDNWEQTGSIDVSGADNEISGGFSGQASKCKSVVVDNEGNTAVLIGRTVMFFDKDYKLTRNISAPDKISEVDGLITTQGGNWYVTCYLMGDSANTSEKAICSIDMHGGTFGDSLGIPYDISFNTSTYSVMNSIDNNGFYVHGSNYVYKYDEGTGTFNKMFCPGDYGINMSVLTKFSVGDDGCFYIENKESTSSDMEYELAVFKKVPASQVKERTQIVLGGLVVSSSLNEPILNFNKYNQDYYVKVKSYRDGVDDYEVAKQNFYNDLLKGEGADIFYVYEGDNGIDIANLGDKKVVADLYEFIDSDDKISRDDFAPNLLTQMEEADGKLYALYFEPQFRILAGKASIFEGCESWNYAKLLEIMKAYPDAVPISDLNRSWVLQQFMWYSMSAFYDKQTGECNFDTDEFKNMLQIVSMAPEQVDYGMTDSTQGENSIAAMIDNDKVLMYESSDITFDDKLYFGDSEVKYLGFPSSGGTAGVSFFFGLAINEQSANKQAAWEFISSLLDKDFQMSGMFPIMNEYVDEKIKDTLSTQKRENEFEAVKERTDYFIDNCVSMRGYDDDIYAIIDEEAAAYFSGARGLDETVKIIQNRAQLYIEEKR